MTTSTDERRARAVLPRVQKSAAVECRTQPCRTTKGCMCYQITQSAINAIRESDEASEMVLVPKGMQEALEAAIPILNENYLWHRDNQSNVTKICQAHALLQQAKKALAAATEADNG